ncbi:MAG TPA: helix-turn-helix domain-containing protein [Pyrinomonadaceae bacterium]|jgi:cytoskeletal protein RodZ|nr:helix-turn-helix domain-containing protein [Pyrinomonadaceae bacterium]
MAASFGEQLKLAREERGIALREISDQTHIPTHYLEAIEANDYKRLPGGIFNKSFIKAYARHVGYDEKEALEAYARTAREQGAPEEVVSTPYQPRVYTDGNSTRSPLVTLLLTVLILAILSLGVYAGLHWYQRRAASKAQASGQPVTPASNAPATQTTNPNAANSPGATQANATEAATAGLTVKIKAVGDRVWVRTFPDGGKSADATLAPDETREFKPEQSLKIQYAKIKARQLEITINGHPARVPSDAKTSIAEMLITKDDYAQLLQ